MSLKEINLYIKYLKEKDPTLPISLDYFENESSYSLIPRYDPCLIRVVEESDEPAQAAKLKVVELPDDVTDWMIQEYDGYEWVSSTHKVYTGYPLEYPGIIITGRGMESQEIYTPPSISIISNQ